LALYAEASMANALDHDIDGGGKSPEAWCAAGLGWLWPGASAAPGDATRMRVGKPFSGHPHWIAWGRRIHLKGR